MTTPMNTPAQRAVLAAHDIQVGADQPGLGIFRVYCPCKRLDQVVQASEVGGAVAALQIMADAGRDHIVAELHKAGAQ